MPLAKSHSLPSKKDRKVDLQANSRRYDFMNARYQAAERIIDELYADICNGVARSDCLVKLKNGLYESQDGKGVCKPKAYDYYNAAIDRLAVNTDIEAEKLRNIFYSRYETLLEEAVKRGDLGNARAILDSMSKIFLGIRDNQTNIQVTSDKENGVTINFGFSSENNNE